MVLLHTPEKQDDFQAPDFKLKSVDGTLYSYADCAGPQGSVIAFICNHCPYVIAIIDRLASTFQTLQDEGIGCAAIMANDTVAYTADSYDNMKIFSKQHNFTFPYLIDETQEVARAYDAVCTPDFFGFDTDGLLRYRGRLDSAANKPADNSTIPELLNAMRTLKDGATPQAQQMPSMGCSIKWKT